MGYFWSGCAGKAKWDLEISGMEVIDSENHTAFHLEAVQTIELLENETLLSGIKEWFWKGKHLYKNSQRLFWY